MCTGSSSEAITSQDAISPLARRGARDHAAPLGLIPETPTKPPCTIASSSTTTSSSFKEVTGLRDRKLDALDEEIESHPDPDSFGLFDRSEYTIGLGLVACQNYLTAVMGPRDRDGRARCLGLGPRHPRRHSIAEIINAGANYVKHHPESLTNRTAIAILDSFGVWKHDRTQVGGRLDYPMGNLLFDVLKPARPRFAELLHSLTRWRDAVIANDESAPAT